MQPLQFLHIILFAFRASIQCLHNTTYFLKNSSVNSFCNQKQAEHTNWKNLLIQSLRRYNLLNLSSKYILYCDREVAIPIGMVAAYRLELLIIGMNLDKFLKYVIPKQWPALTDNWLLKNLALNYLCTFIPKQCITIMFIDL